MAEGKKKQKKSPWWYKLGILVFGAVFCVSAFMAGLSGGQKGSGRVRQPK